MREKWKPIKEDTKYEVSNNGRVRSWKKKGGGVYDAPNIMRQSSDQKGYKRINFLINGRTANKKLHRLVAEAFIPNPGNKPQVNHKDGDKSNNSVGNLEWVTNTENMRHAYSTGVKTNRGEMGSKSILVEEDIIEIRQLLKKGVYQKDIARMFGVAQITISNIKTGRNWSHV